MREAIVAGLLLVMAEYIAVLAYLPMALIFLMGKIAGFTSMGFIEFTRGWFRLEWMI